MPFVEALPESLVSSSLKVLSQSLQLLEAFAVEGAVGLKLRVAGGFSLELHLL